MGIQTMFPAWKVKPVSQYGVAANLGVKKGGFGPFNAGDLALLKENYSLSTWIVLGCIIQGLINLAVPHYLAIIPAMLVFVWGILDTLLMIFGIKKDIWMQNVIVGKFSVAYPIEGEARDIVGKPGDNGPGAVMILGTRSNSPLGMFAPGFKELGDTFRDMVANLENNKEISGFMGMSSWLGAGERESKNEYATISYWRSVEDIHQFALSSVHRKAWQWWNKTVAEHSHLGIMHEVFEIPKHNGFEAIYVNYHPTGLAATTRLVGGSGKAEELKEWVNPIVDARRGVYRSSRGRMSRGDADGSSNEKVIIDPYAEVRI